MLITTTSHIEGMHIAKYYGIVSGETIIGANFVRDLFASVRDFVGGVQVPTKRCFAKPNPPLYAKWRTRLVALVLMP